MTVKKKVDPFDAIRRARYETNEINVAFSCGKDGMALAELCYDWFDRIGLFHMFITPGMSFHQQYIRFVEDRYKDKLQLGKVVQVPHWSLAKRLQSASLRPDGLRSENVPNLKVRDTEVAIRKLNGISWFAWGQKKGDSLDRRAMLNVCEGVDLRSSRCYPLMDWSDRTVLQFLKERKIPLSPEYSWGTGRSYGGQLEGEYLIVLRDNSPADYARVLKRFPFAEAEVARVEMGMKEAPGVKKQA